MLCIFLLHIITDLSFFSFPLTSVTVLKCATDKWQGNTNVNITYFVEATLLNSICVGMWWVYGKAYALNCHELPTNTTHTHTNNSNVMCRYEFHKLYPMYTILVLFITTDLLCLLSIIVPIVWSYKLFTVCAIRSQSHVYIHQLIMQWFWVVSFWSVTMQTHFYRSLANIVGFTF